MCPLYNMESTTNTNVAADDAAMEAMYDETLKNFTEGSIVTGKILSVSDGDVLIDIGYKSEASCPFRNSRNSTKIRLDRKSKYSSSSSKTAMA